MSGMHTDLREKWRREHAGRPVGAFQLCLIEFLPSPGEYGYVASMNSGKDGGWQREGFFAWQWGMFRDAVAVIPDKPLSEWEEVLIEGLIRECGVAFVTEAEVAGYMAMEGVRWRTLFHFGHPRADAWYATTSRPWQRRRLWLDVWRARALAWLCGTPSGVSTKRGTGAPVR